MNNKILDYIIWILVALLLVIIWPLTKDKDEDDDDSRPA